MSNTEPLRLTRAQIREIDRRAIEEYHIPGIVLMENAARGAASVAWEMLSKRTSPKILIVCGSGNNAGDGFAAARHLHNRGADVSIEAIDGIGKLMGDALLNMKICAAMGIAAHDYGPEVVAHDFDLVIDAIFGTGLSRPIEGMFASWIREFVKYINLHPKPVLAIDLPSGMDCDTGEPLGVCIAATHTVTFVAAKAGFANPKSKQYTGKITVADIGCPRELIEEVARRG